MKTSPRIVSVPPAAQQQRGLRSVRMQTRVRVSDEHPVDVDAIAKTWDILLRAGKDAMRDVEARRA